LWKVKLQTGRYGSEPQEVILYHSPFLPKPTTQVVNQPFSHASIESAWVVFLHVRVVDLRNRTAQHLNPSVGQAEVYHKRKLAAVTPRWRRNNWAPRTRETQPPQTTNKEKPMEHDSVRCGNFAIGCRIPSLRHSRLQSTLFPAVAPWQWPGSVDEFTKM
jgi:hypothetical protein